MDINLKTLDKIPRKVLQEILDACNVSFQKELSTENFYGKNQTTWSIPEIGLAYKSTESVDDLRKFVYEITDTQNIRQAYAKIFERIEQLDSGQKNITENEKAEKVDKNTVTPDAGTREVQEEILNERIEGKKEADIKAHEDVEKLIEQRLEHKTVTAVPKYELPTYTLNEEDIQTISNYREASIVDPGTLQTEIETKIRESIPESERDYIPDQLITNKASEFVTLSQNLPEKINTTGVVMNPASPLTAILDENNEILKSIIPEKSVLRPLTENARILAITESQMHDSDISLTSSFLSPGLQEFYYGSNTITEFGVTTDESRSSDGIKINLKEVYQIGEDFQNVFEKINKGEISGVGMDVSGSGIRPTFVPSTDPETVEKTKKIVKEIKLSDSRINQSELYKRFHKNITKLDNLIPQAISPAGEVVNFKNLGEYTNYLNIIKDSTTTKLPVIKFADGRVIEFQNINELNSYISGFNSSLSAKDSLSSFLNSKNIILTGTSLSIGAFAVNNYRLQSFIAFDHGGKMLFHTGVGKYSFSVVNTGNFVLGGVRKEIYQAGFEFGSKSLKLALTKSGGQITSVSLKIGVGTGKIVTKALPSFLSKIITFLGGLSAPETLGLSVVVGWVIKKIGEFFSKILPPETVKKFFNDFKEFIFGSGILALGVAGATGSIGALLYGLPATIIGGAAGVAAGGFSTAGLATAVGGIVNVAKIVMATALAGIGGPILFILLGFPVIIALILFIINSGAYLVPPGPLSSNPGSFSSPYIDVQKTSTVNILKNSDLTKTISYTVIIKPKKGNLTNIKITDNCQVVSKTNKNCPAYVVPKTLPDIDLTNPSGGAFTYVMVIDPSFSDSSIVNTVTITADTVDKAGVSASASNSITIGNPPISCPLIGGRVTNGSYNGPANTGHGSPSYWQSTGLSRYAIPQSSSCMSPTDCSYYGYAADIFPSSSNDVFAPTVLGKDTSWNCSYAFSNGGGSAGYTYHCLSTDGNAMLVLTHVNKDIKSGTVKSGEKIGTLFNQGDNNNGGNTHLHIEFQLNGQYVKPENYFCK